MVVDDEIVRERATHPDRIVIVEPQAELGDGPEGRGRGIDRERASPRLREGSTRVVGVEPDGGEDPPTLVDLHQREIFHLATAVGRPARRYAPLNRDEPSLLMDPRTGPTLPVGDPTIEVGRDQHMSTPVLVLRVRHK